MASDSGDSQENAETNELIRMNGAVAKELDQTDWI